MIITEELRKAFHDKHGKDVHPDYVLIPQGIFDEFLNSIQEDGDTLIEGNPLETDLNENYERKAMLIPV